jgi:3-dehydroquinate dehydratase-1
MAVTMSSPPDLFELRLDHLLSLQEEVENRITNLPVPVIITARHPAEGGANGLPGIRRHELIARFLRYARYVDVELRSAESFHALLNSPLNRNVERILSLHDFDSTPTPRSLHAKARTARSHGAALFKVATRTDTGAQLARLLEFIAQDDFGIPVSLMGMGKLGNVSRLLLAACGSTMAYAALADKTVEGQLSVPELQDAFRILGLR